MEEMIFDPIEEVKQPGIFVVEEIIRNYPAMVAAVKERQCKIRTTNYSAVRGGHGGRKDPTANAATWEFFPETERRYRAVRKAVAQTRHRKNGLVRMQTIDLVYWKRTHTLREAADVAGCSETVAKQYRREFIQAVKENLGITNCEGCIHYRKLLYEAKACHYCLDNHQLRVHDLDGCYSKDLERCPNYEREAI